MLEITGVEGYAVVTRLTEVISDCEAAREIAIADCDLLSQVSIMVGDVAQELEWQSKGRQVPVFHGWGGGQAEIKNRRSDVKSREE